MLRQIHTPTLRRVLLNPLSRETFLVAMLKAEPNLPIRRGLPRLLRSKLASCFEVESTLDDPSILVTRKLVTTYASKKEIIGSTIRIVAQALAIGPMCLTSEIDVQYQEA